MVRVSPGFHKLIKDVQRECKNNNKRVLTSQEITSKISRKVTKQDILYNSNFRLF